MSFSTEDAATEADRALAMDDRIPVTVLTDSSDRGRPRSSIACSRRSTACESP